MYSPAQLAALWEACNADLAHAQRVTALADGLGVSLARAYFLDAEQADICARAQHGEMVISRLITPAPGRPIPASQ